MKEGEPRVREESNGTWVARLEETDRNIVRVWERARDWAPKEERQETGKQAEWVRRRNGRQQEEKKQEMQL